MKNIIFYSETFNLNDPNFFKFRKLLPQVIYCRGLSLKLTNNGQTLFYLSSFGNISSKTQSQIFLKYEIKASRPSTYLVVKFGGKIFLNLETLGHVD